MEKLFGALIAIFIMLSAAIAEEPVPYFEANDVEFIYTDETDKMILENGIVFYNGTDAEAYPCEVTYMVVRDDVFSGRRYIEVCVKAGIYDLPDIAHSANAMMFYALRDYYTGMSFDIDTEVDDRALKMYDFTVDYGDSSWDIKAGVLVNIYDIENGLEFVFNYQFIVDEDYDGIVICSEPVFEFSDADDFYAQLHHHHTDECDEHGEEEEHEEFDGLYARMRPVDAGE